VQDVFERNDELSIPEAGYDLPHGRRAPSNRRLAITAAAIGAALLAVGGGLELASRHSSGIPVIAADSRPLRVRPDNPGGLQVLGANESAADASGAEALAPPPEAPDPKGLRAQAQAQAALSPPVPSAAALAMPGSAAPDVPLPPSTGADQAATVPPPARAHPAPAPRVIAPAPARATVAAPDAVPGGHRFVQLAAVGSEDAANSEWTRLAKRMPDLLADRHPEIVRFEHDGHTFFRLRTGGFADNADAAAFCGRVRAKGGNCAVF